MDVVSIIVPVYKVEAYLERCIYALICQTYPEIEIILVDDGSPDRSGEICDEFAAKDSRIVVFHQANQGVSAARNMGLKLSRGDWICFCDGDDWYEKNYVETLLAGARKANADFVLCDYQIVNEQGKIQSRTHVASLGDNRKTVIALGPTASCVHMIKKSLFKEADVSYPLGYRQSEELPVIPVLAKYATDIALVNQPLYNYFQRGDGTSASNNREQGIEDSFACWRIMRTALGKEYEAEAEYHAIYSLLYGNLLKMCKNRVSSRKIREGITAFEEMFPNYRKNPYLNGMGWAKRGFLALAHWRCIPSLRCVAWLHGKIIG